MPDGLLQLPTPGSLFGSIVIGTIGLAAFIYGRKSQRYQPVVLGIALMVYPYFVTQTWLLYGIGAVLIAGLFVWRD